MRPGIIVDVTAADRDRLEAIIADRNSPQKHVWRAAIVLATADGLGTISIMQRTGKSKTAVWRWQERFAAEGVEGLLRDKNRPSRRSGPRGASGSSPSRWPNRRARRPTGRDAPWPRRRASASPMSSAHGA